MIGLYITFLIGIFGLLIYLIVYLFRLPRENNEILCILKNVFAAMLVYVVVYAIKELLFGVSGTLEEHLLVGVYVVILFVIWHLFFHYLPSIKKAHKFVENAHKKGMTMKEYAEWKKERQASIKMEIDKLMKEEAQAEDAYTRLITGFHLNLLKEEAENL